MGVTVVTSLHQPSTRMLNLCDQILILAEGNLVYDDIPTEITNRLH